MTHYHRILQEYVKNHAIGAMLREGWAYKPAKSYGWQKAARGADFHVDQPLRTHILNGLYALTRVLEFLQKQHYYTLSEVNFRRTLVLYTLHDAYKDKALAAARIGTSEFDIPLNELNALYQRMHLDDFIDLTPADLRVASVSLLSQKVGDIASGTAGISRLFPLVHLADALASQQTARDYRTAENRLREISKDEATRRRNQARILQRLETKAAAPDPALPELALYYHELDEYRGLSTLLLHQVIEEVLAPYGLFPLLYFANGVLYIGKKGLEADPESLRTQAARLAFTRIREGGGQQKLTLAQQACTRDKGVTQFKAYAYLFCSFQDLLEAANAKTVPLRKAAGFFSKKIITPRVAKGKYQSMEDFFAEYEIPGDLDENEQQAQRLYAATHMIMAVENIAAAFVKEAGLSWLCTLFQTPPTVSATLQKRKQDLCNGGIADHCYIIAYHWLVQTRFLDDRSWLEVRPEEIKQAIVEKGLSVFAPYEREELFLAYGEKMLGIQSDIATYLQENLVFSFDPRRQTSEDRLQEYEKPRRYTHKHMCVICNRLIPATMSKKQSTIDTLIAQQNAQVFSNRRLPTGETNDMMVWCPMCYLEFLLRKLGGQSYPEGSDYTASYRLHLYILPDYAFTPEFWKESGEDLLGEFHPQTTTVTKLALRGRKEEPSLPGRWLEWGTVDEALLDLVRSLFVKQAENMKTHGKLGDRLTFSFQHPNYMLFTYDNVVFASTDKSLHPTRTEIWAKALYAAAFIHLLVGARVYITDKPYLTFTRPEEMKTILEMEGLPPLFFGLFPVSLNAEHAEETLRRATESSARLPLAALSTLLDLLSAIWEMNAALFPQKSGKPRNLDKQIAVILQEVATNPLAGAALAKMRARDGLSLYPTFTRACRLLFPQTATNDLRRDLHEEGYTLMLDKEGEAWMNLAQEITNKSLQLYRPNKGKDGRGRAHRFETLFRTGVEALKGNSSDVLSDEERVSRVAGKILKRLERLQENRQQGYVPSYGDERVAIARQFAELLVFSLFNQRCGKSIARLTHEENNLADAVYFLTLEEIPRYWATHGKTQPSDERPGEDDQQISAD